MGGAKRLTALQAIGSFVQRLDRFAVLLQPAGRGRTTACARECRLMFLLRLKVTGLLGSQVGLAQRQSTCLRMSTHREILRPFICKGLLFPARIKAHEAATARIADLAADRIAIRTNNDLAQFPRQARADKFLCWR